MSDDATGQVSAEAANVYEEFYLPALFEQWSPLVVEAAQIQRGHRVVDVACGTGALTLVVAERVGPDGSVVGVDINTGMLHVARVKAPQIDWQQSPAESLPFEDGRFDSVVCQFGLMYFEDQQGALREMMRVLRPGGSLVTVVWDQLENNPGLAAEERVWQQLFGAEMADAAPYSLGDKTTLKRLYDSSGILDAVIETHPGTARFPSIETWIHTGAKGWTQDDAIDDDQLDLLLRTAKTELADFESPRGDVAFPMSAQLVVAQKPGSE